jgi:putative endonuclease
MNYNKDVGKFGEELAINYLSKKGYKIIEKNKKVSYFEFDILANFKEKMVFIEVKTRASNVFGKAEEAITHKKMINLKKGINNYLLENKIVHKSIQVDLIAIDINKNKKVANIKHYKDII